MQTFGYEESIKITNKDVILKANTVSLINIFKYYNLNLDHANRKIVCPFKHHKNGRENSGSFNFYPDSNSFWCFGCKTGTTPCDFVANIDDCNRIQAAEKILKQFNSSVIDENFIEKESYQDTVEIMLNFSNNIRKFREKNTSETAFLYIENICKIYDSINAKHNLTNDALNTVITQLLEKVHNYNE